MKLKVKLLNEKSKLPFRAHPTDAGFDLTVTEIKKKSLFKIHYGLGIAADFPENMYAEVYSRSSIHKLFLWLSNSTGIIDNSYKGEWQAVFYKIPLLSKPYKVGDRCCQAVFKYMQDAGLSMIKVDELSDSIRGEGGFGSTGK